jgi:hypothetical protein
MGNRADLAQVLGQHDARLRLRERTGGRGVRRRPTGGGPSPVLRDSTSPSVANGRLRRPGENRGPAGRPSALRGQRQAKAPSRGTPGWYLSGCWICAVVRRGDAPAGVPGTCGSRGGRCSSGGGESSRSRRRTARLSRFIILDRRDASCLMNRCM